MRGRFRLLQNPCWPLLEHLLVLRWFHFRHNRNLGTLQTLKQETTSPSTLKLAFSLVSSHGTDNLYVPVLQPNLTNIPFEVLASFGMCSEAFSNVEDDDESEKTHSSSSEKFLGSEQGDHCVNIKLIGRL